jgi:beta-N-acetylhexosaminidase
MPVPSLRLRLWQVLVLAALLAAGAGGWFFFVRDVGEEGSENKADKNRKRERPLSDDPLVKDMSTAEMAAQVLMLGFEGTGPDAPQVAAAAEDGVGALVVRTPNWTGLQDGRKLTEAIREGGPIPPLAAVAQEGGEFRALPDLPPGERALDIARKGSVTAAETWALETSAALAQAGFHLNLFPVADVATLDSPVAGRAFSDDAAEVAALTESALAGCKEADLACAPLHFPGLGTASQDPAQGPATVATDLATLEGRDFLPFRTGAVRKAPAIVVSLGLYPDFDPVVPAALTPAVATALLRDDFGFRGVAISDDLSAGAVSVNYSEPEAAVAALAAGIDLVQISDPGDPKELIGAIEEAVSAGDLPKERLALAAERVVDLKREVGLIGSDGRPSGDG